MLKPSLKKQQYSVKTFGCKVNTYDTSLIQKQLSDQFKETCSESSDFHIVNTCAVTKTAILDSLRWIRRYKKQNPSAKIVVTGCGAQTELDYYAKDNNIDLIIANSHKNEFLDILQNYKDNKNANRIFHSNIFKNQNKGEGGQVESHHSRLFLKIQDGCSQFCTFCIIPFARGKSRSLTTQHLIEQINKHHSEGILEVVLTGVHIADYFDPESGSDLTKLVKNILLKTTIPRIRLSSLEPIELTDELLSFYQNPRMCPHFHLSIQSGSTKILKNMKRKYTREDVQTCLNKIQKLFPHAFVGMDIIAGFPGETQQDFEETYELFKQTSWTDMHVFPYSPRPKTYALRIKDHCSPSTISHRALQLRNLSQQRYHEKAQDQIGQTKHFLPLKKGAISRDYWHADWSHPNKEMEHQEQKARLISWNPSIKKFQAQLEI